MTKWSPSCQPVAQKPYQLQCWTTVIANAWSSLSFLFEVWHIHALEKNIPTNVSRQGPKLYVLEFNLLNFTLFAQLLLSLLLSVAITKNSAKWSDYIFTKQIIKHMVSTFSAYGILFGKKQALYIPCQRCPPKKINSQRKNMLCFDNNGEGGRECKVLPKYILFFLPFFLFLLLHFNTTKQYSKGSKQIILMKFLNLFCLYLKCSNSSKAESLICKCKHLQGASCSQTLPAHSNFPAFTCRSWIWIPLLI